ncbi:22740_t:CDS:2 [Entrophospora sp. SA101]|nr:9974_t:CDS:2 [Entrophospora sp. SA101]CAJ0758512.1 22740_t:CDS:2 [Entrophospora sp. SA101]CAJ0853996.1 4768_t:CDS:2 [Entrophospora sp. SA101]
MQILMEMLFKEPELLLHAFINSGTFKLPHDLILSLVESTDWWDLEYDISIWAPHLINDSSDPAYKELFNKLKEDYGVVLPDTDTAPFEIVKSLKHELILGQLREPESEMSKLSSSDSDSKPDLALKE